jgi:hypothetical protein
MVQVKFDIVFSTGTTIPNTFSVYNDDPSDITGVQYLPLFRPVFQNITLLSNDDEIISYGRIEINKLSSGYGLIVGVNFFRSSGNEFVVPYGKTANLKADFTYITN